ncbi:MAG TPA: adenylate/guanylate cyclase domain-containing protein [Methylomirabilota bacterium]|nr:adenylate/guanylate cyclase domain-containing protein [Methylomirabilota bacterium]
MTCAGCGQANPAGAQFCGGCGSRLAAACPSCQAPNPPGNRFCHQCGRALAGSAPAGEPAAAPQFASPSAYTPRHLAEKILTTAGALAGERKQVTVLFVDVAGFTSLSERLDPEDVHRLMSRAFDLMLAEVHRYEGTVNQFLGDGIMALFGAPIAHEDHARRAVHAALGIARALEAYEAELRPRGITFRVRQGLNTGLVVVGSIGSDLRMDYTAVGDTTNVAARMQQVSEPGRVTVSEATHRLIQGYFETRAVGEKALKGKADPVPVWEVVAARETRTRLEVMAERGLTPLVGRERELGQLVDAFARARSGAGQVVLVVGEPGIGKSRLLHEVHRRIGADGAWHEGHCLSFGKAMAFHPLVDLVRRWFGIDEVDGEAAIATKLERGAAAIHTDLVAVTPYLRALLSVDPGDAGVRAMIPAERRGETFEALRRLLVHAAEREPQILVIEDLHWIDGASEQFLATLVDSVPAVPAMLVFTYRPGYASPFGDRSYLTRIVPAPLSADESARMAAAVLATDTLPRELRAVVATRAEGNPFYVEELVKSLEESGALRRAGDRLELARPVTASDIPGTIQDVIAARIDRLAEAPKRALQLASVIGREFTHRLVDRLADIRERTEGLLRELTALELIHERRRFPELAYMFKHALTQDVTYASLLVQRRKELHGLIGVAIEELYVDRLPEHFEMLAHHFSRAEDWKRAFEYLLKAAEKATQAAGLRQALDLYAQALTVAERLRESVPPATIMAIHRARADLFFGTGEFVRSREAAGDLLEVARGTGDRAEEAEALARIASALQWAEDFPSALERARQSIEIAESVGAQGALGFGLYIRGYLHGLNARLDAAEADVDRALQISRAVGDRSREALALHFLALYRGWQGQYRPSLERADEGVRIAREHRLVIPLLRCFWNQGLAYNDMGEYDRALVALEEGLALAEKVGDDAYIPRYLNTIGWLRIECGDYRAGVELSQLSYEVTGRSSRAGHGTGAERRSFIRNNQAEAWMAQGELAAAAEALEESHHVVLRPPPSQWMTWRYSTQCYAALGQLALLRGDPERARRLADQSLEIAVPTRSRKFESWAWRIKGESATARRAWDEAEDALRRSLALAEGIGQPRQTWLGHVALGRLDAARGRRDDAQARYRAAAAIIADLREKTREAGLRAGLESSPLVLEVQSLIGRS